MIYLEQGWTRIDNLPLGMYSEFEDIREECELLGDKEEWEVLCHADSLLLKKMPKVFQQFSITNDVEVEYYPFEEDDEGYTGYAIYIYFSKELVEYLITYLFEKNEKYIEYYYS